MSDEAATAMDAQLMDGVDGDGLDGSAKRRQIMEGARTVFLASDHSKFVRPALVRQGHLNQIDALFTDKAPPADMAETLATAGTLVYIAE